MAWASTAWSGGCPRAGPAPLRHLGLLPVAETRKPGLALADRIDGQPPPRGIDCAASSSMLSSKFHPVLGQQRARQIPARSWSCHPPSDRASPSRRRRCRSGRRQNQRRRRQGGRIAAWPMPCPRFLDQVHGEFGGLLVLPSSMTSRPFMMAPTGLIRSWQTREHSSAARSRPSRSDGAGHEGLRMRGRQHRRLGDSGVERQTAL